MSSPEGAAQTIVPVGFCAALSGLLNLYRPDPGLTPGAVLCRPFGPEPRPMSVSRQKLVSMVSKKEKREQVFPAPQVVALDGGLWGFVPPNPPIPVSL